MDICTNNCELNEIFGKASWISEQNAHISLITYVPTSMHKPISRFNCRVIDKWADDI